MTSHPGGRSQRAWTVTFSSCRHLWCFSRPSVSHVDGTIFLFLLMDWLWMYYSTKSLFHLELFRGVNFTGRKKKTKNKKHVSLKCSVLCLVNYIYFASSVWSKHSSVLLPCFFNIYVALAIIKLHKQGCLFSPLYHFFFFYIYNT